MTVTTIPATASVAARDFHPRLYSAAAISLLLLAGAQAQAASLVIDNFYSTVGCCQAVTDNTKNGVQTTSVFTQTADSAAQLQLAGGQRIVVVSLRDQGPSYASMSTSIANGSANISLTQWDSSGTVEYRYENLALDIAAAGSSLVLNSVQNRIVGGPSSNVNTPEQAIAAGHTATLTLVDSAGHAATSVQPIPYLGSQVVPFVISFTNFPVSWGLAELLADNPQINLRSIATISLTFDVTNTGGLAQQISFAGGPSSGFVTAGDPFPFTVVPVPAAAWLFISALGLLGVARRRRA